MWCWGDWESLGGDGFYIERLGTKLDWFQSMGASPFGKMKH